MASQLFCKPISQSRFCVFARCTRLTVKKAKRVATRAAISQKNCLHNRDHIPALLGTYLYSTRRGRHRRRRRFAPLKLKPCHALGAPFWSTTARVFVARDQILFTHRTSRSRKRKAARGLSLSLTLCAPRQPTVIFSTWHTNQTLQAIDRHRAGSGWCAGAVSVTAASVFNTAQKYKKDPNHRA